MLAWTGMLILATHNDCSSCSAMEKHVFPIFPEGLLGILVKDIRYL